MDVPEIKEKLVLYTNDLIKGLKLDHPLWTSIDDVQIPILVEINCRLIGLDFNDYIPSVDPIEDVQGIIFSLQERYGKELFRQLNARKIAQHEPVALACLVQILHTIYDHGRGKGRRFLPPAVNNQDTTILDESGRPIEGGEDSELIDDDDTGTTLEELIFSFDLGELEVGTDSEDSAISSAENNDLYYSFDSSFDSNNTQETKLTQKGHNTAKNEEKTPEQSGTTAPSDQTDPGTRARHLLPHSSTPKRAEKQHPPMHIKPPTITIPFAGKGKSGASQRAPDGKVAGAARPTSSKVLAVGTILGKESDYESEKENLDISVEDFATRAISQLGKIRSEIEDRVRQQLAEVLHKVRTEAETAETQQSTGKREKSAPVSVSAPGKMPKIKSLPAECKQHRKTRESNPNGFAGVGPIKHDRFGKAYRDQFPYYPGGIIRVQCNASARRRLPPPPRHGHAFEVDKVPSPMADFMAERKLEKMSKHMQELQETYNNELDALRMEFSRLVKEGGPKSFTRIRNAQTESYHRLRSEARKAVDKIINTAESMYMAA